MASIAGAPSAHDDVAWQFGPDPAFESNLRAWALPGAIAVFTLLHATGPGTFFMRLVFGRALHELGHAIAAWLLGYPALPLLWSTVVAPTRSRLAVAVLSITLIGLIRSRYKHGDRFGALGLGVLLLVQLVGSVFCGPSSAQMIITFAGDLGCLILGPALIALFLLGPDHVLNRGWLRWGWLTIGAAAFVDAFLLWWSARSDVDVIPFGAIEGVGLSDASKLCDVYDWSTNTLVNRYVAFGVTSLVALIALYAGDQLRRRMKR